MDSDFPFIDSGDELAAFLDRFPAGEPCGIDTEADSLHVFREKICLIQLVCGESIALIDPLNIDTLDPLHAFLEGREVWLHGADYDLMLWRRSYDYLPERVFDTQLAARFLGVRELGLAAVLERFFPVKVDKGPQKANWGKRPLDGRMLHYAANDVRYLLPMARLFSDQLREKDRWDWFLQSSAAVLRNALSRPDRPNEDAWQISGWGKLDPRAQAYLRRLWQWRNSIASRWDRPPFKVMGNKQLLEGSQRLASGGTVKLSPKFPPYVHRSFQKAVAEAAELPDDQLPRKKKRRNVPRPKDWESVFTGLKETRDSAAAGLEVDPALIGSRQLLETWAFAMERTPELRGELFLPWQESLLFTETPSPVA